MNYIKSLEGLDINTTINNFVIIFCLVFGWIIRILYETFSLNYKLNREYKFNQIKKIKDELSKTKTFLLNSSEELYERLENLNINISKYWHKVEEEKWGDESKYYIQSFVYRIILFLYWVMKVDRSILCTDSTVIGKKDQEYLIFIKAFKNILCDTSLTKQLNNLNSDNNINHFYKNNLIKYIKYIENNGEVVDYNSFVKKLKIDYSDIKIVFKFVSNIRDNNFDISLNKLRCLHILLSMFLIRHGQSHQKVSKKVFKEILKYYSEKIKNKNDFYNFIIKYNINYKKGLLKKYVLKK